MPVLIKAQHQKVVLGIPPNLATRYKHFFIGLFIILILSIIAVIFVHMLPFDDHSYRLHEKISLSNVINFPVSIIKGNWAEAKVRDAQCNYWTCFNVYRCGRSKQVDRIAVYVYPPRRYIDERGSLYSSIVSREFYELLDAIIHSKYYTADPSEACVFVPSLDLLNLDKVSEKNISKVLQSLEFWRDDGENHLLFNMLHGHSDIQVARAMWAAAGQDTWSHRRNFDIPWPVFSPLQQYTRKSHINQIRSWLVISSEPSIDFDLMHELRQIESRHPELLVLSACAAPTNRTERCRRVGGEIFKELYPDVLARSTFCLIIRNTASLLTPTLLEAMSVNCIPVIVSDGLIMPFAPHIDWHRAAVFILERNMPTLMETLKSISDERVADMQRQIAWLYQTYFESIAKIVLTTLDIIQDRVYPHWEKIYEDWNIIPVEKPRNPLFLPINGVRSLGFTAVILTYDRIQSLYTLIEKLARVPSLAKVLVVWNNQKKSPPHSSLWPRINKPLKVIATQANRLSNRFFPYAEIETEAILSIDDDIIMLTADELEFGFEVWREFPDRIVGFPSRTHRWDNVTNTWRYESEWTNDISMVLTGAAFLHKYWSHAYTTLLPANVRDWVDEHMNCEDIAMNFLVANITNKAPIKVAPRKKFKCPECINTEMLSADFGHMVERSACVDRFVRAFGRMPLRPVEFRADPVLFRDPFPEKLKRFNDIGSL